MDSNKRYYETMFIVRPTLVEEEIRAKVDFFKDLITKNGGDIETCLDMGMRTLAYEVKKNHRGYYFVIYFRAEPSLIAELVRVYRINEDILKFIVIRYENKRERAAWQTLVDRANKKPEKQKTLKRDGYGESSAPTDQVAATHSEGDAKESTPEDLATESTESKEDTPDSQPKNEGESKVEETKSESAN